MTEQLKIAEAVKDIEIPKLDVSLAEGVEDDDEFYGLGDNNAAEVNSALLELVEALRLLVKENPNNDVLTDQIYIYLEDNLSGLFEVADEIEEQSGYNDLLDFRSVDELYDAIVEDEE